MPGGASFSCRDARDRNAQRGRPTSRAPARRRPDHGAIDRTARCSESACAQLHATQPAQLSAASQSSRPEAVVGNLGAIHAIELQLLRDHSRSGHRGRPRTRHSEMRLADARASLPCTSSVTSSASVSLEPPSLVAPIATSTSRSAISSRLTKVNTLRNGDDVIIGAVQPELVKAE